MEEFSLLSFKVGGGPRTWGRWLPEAQVRCFGQNSRQHLIRPPVILGRRQNARRGRGGRGERDPCKHPMLGSTLCFITCFSGCPLSCCRDASEGKKAGGSDPICPGQVPVLNQHAKGTRDFETFQKWPTAK